jgi:two-component system sensor histidine kinase DctS
VLWHGWQPRADLEGDGLPDLLRQARAINPWNDEALASMLAISVGLRRSSYAGPLRGAEGVPGDTVWLAVPYFERGEFLGNYLAALSMQRCVEGLVPTWFHQTHRVSLASDTALGEQAQGNNSAQGDTAPYLAAMNLPGTDMFIEVAPLRAQPAMVPRIFLVVALLFLAGMLVSLLALRRDIAKRQRVQALLQAQMVLRTAMENSVTIGMRAWASNGQILYVNEAFCRMVGYRAEDLVGRSAPMPYWPANRADEINVMHDDVIAKGTRSEGLEVQFEHHDGHLVDVLIHEAPLMTATGEHVGWMSSVLDISEKKRAERLAAQQQERLEASGRLVAVGEAASTLAHELNQPLGALSSFAHGLLNRLRDRSVAADEVERVVQRMARLSDKAGGIIQRVNAFARRRELVLAPVELTHFVQRCMTTQPRSSAASVHWVGTPYQVWVQADELLLEHVVNNLLGNALAWAQRGNAQASDGARAHGGAARVRVAVQLHEREQAATLTVADNGPGVGEDAREQIFNAFFSTQEGGMGMGLAICRSIVEAHHGRIEVGQDTDLGGALFTVWLPLARRNSAEGRQAP